MRIGLYNIFAGIHVVFIFGAAFFFDLLFPEGKEDRDVGIASRVCALAAVLFIQGDIIARSVSTAHPICLRFAIIASSLWHRVAHQLPA